MPDTCRTANFMPEVREWMRRQQPSDTLLAAVVAWEQTLLADPIGDASPDGGTMLFRVVPGTEHSPWVVTLSYDFNEHSGLINCVTICCQRFPVSTQPPWPPEPHPH